MQASVSRFARPTLAMDDQQKRHAACRRRLNTGPPAPV
jgi:hypothetical protein